jgi:AcrR family transcriptional regulator
MDTCIGGAPGEGKPMSLATRDKLIRAAYELFYRRGFHAVGLDQIIKDAGVTKSTFYNHFESKDALVLAVVKWRDTLWPEHLRATLRKRAGDRPRDQLMAFFDVLDEVWGTDGFNGCLFIRAAAEFPLSHDPIHVVVEDFVRSVETALRELAGYAGARDPGTLSRELLLLVSGAYAQSQMGDPVAAARMGKRLAARVLTERLPHAKARVKRKRRTRG